LKINTLQSCYLENLGNGKFKMEPLPIEAQISQVDGMVVDDFDGDGNLDVAISGNDFGTEVGTGRYDAFNGLLLKGDGKGNFKPLTILQSGIYIPGDGKGLVKLMGAKDKYLMAAVQNRGPLKIYSLKKAVKTIQLEPLDEYALITYKTGKTGKQEFYYGTSYLSQSGRFLVVDSTMKSVVITNSLGKKRSVR